MRRAAFALCLLCAPMMANADGTAEAAITLQGRTVFLSADNTSSALPMVQRDGALLHLTFAQLHLRFPLPPTLQVTLREDGDGWLLEALSYDAPTLSIAASPAAFRVVTDPDTAQLILTGEVLQAGTLGIMPTLMIVEIDLD